MRVSVELPDPPRLEPLLHSLSQQYQGVMRALLQLQQEDRVSPVLQAIQSQQDGLVSAFQHMMALMHQGRQQDQQQMQHVLREEVSAPQQEASQALIAAMRGMKRSLSALPEDLGSVMNKQLKSRQHELMKQAPIPRRAAPESANRIVQKLDEMETALVNATRRSRSRTFGSNY